MFRYAITKYDLLENVCFAARQKQVALASVSELMDLLVDSVNKNVQEIFVNQKRIEVETRALVNSVGQYTKQTQQWVRTLSSFDDALKVRQG